MNEMKLVRLNTLAPTKKKIGELQQSLVVKYGIDNRICQFEAQSIDELNENFSGRLFCLHSWVQAVATYGIWTGKVYAFIGILGASICPILDLIYDRHLMLESDNLGLYIGIQVALILINGTLHMAVFAFFDVARVDYKRRSYLMDVLNSTI